MTGGPKGVVSMRRQVAALAAVLTAAGFSFAQAPQRVPRETLSAAVGGKKVEISYGRPALKGRGLDELMKALPADRIWRAGENQVTTLKAEGDLMLGSQKVAAGTYSVYVHIPESGDWSLVLNSDPGIEVGKLLQLLRPGSPPLPPERASLLWPRLDGYSKNIADKEVARAAMKPAPAGFTSSADAFTMTLAEAKGAAVLSMAWADQAYSIELRPAK
jgi:hypothetical protein